MLKIQSYKAFKPLHFRDRFLLSLLTSLSIVGLEGQ
jgi:hypothetical protein